MNYEVVGIHNEDGFCWGVLETRTEQIIDAFYFKDDAEAYVSFLLDGGAFDGFTPSFILRSVKVPESLDTSFDRAFSDI